MAKAPDKHASAVALGKLGGEARARNLSAARLSKIGQIGAEAARKARKARKQEAERAE